MLVIALLVMAAVAEDTVEILDHLAERPVTTAAAVDILLENVVNPTRPAILVENPAISAVIALREVAAVQIGR